MNIRQLKSVVENKYRKGQVVTLDLNESEKYGGNEITVEIVDFYPEVVLTTRNGCKESFRYWDFLRATNGIKKVDIKKTRARHHLSAC